MTDEFEAARERMVREQIEVRGVHDARVLAALRDTPRHRFVDSALWTDAYSDRPLPIGLDQTISQPFMVGFMLQALEPAGRRVLEVGTGSGYGTAVLARLASKVYSIEVEPSLSQGAAKILKELRIANVHLRVGDGMKGWPEGAPFSRIVLTAAVDEVPAGLLSQLEPGGWFVGPVGGGLDQRLLKIRRTSEGYETADLMPVVFVKAHHR